MEIILSQRFNARNAFWALLIRDDSPASRLPRPRILSSETANWLIAFYCTGETFSADLFPSRSNNLRRFTQGGEYSQRFLPRCSSRFIRYNALQAQCPELTRFLSGKATIWERFYHARRAWQQKILSMPLRDIEEFARELQVSDNDARLSQQASDALI